MVHLLPGSVFMHPPPLLPNSRPLQLHSPLVLAPSMAFTGKRVLTHAPTAWLHVGPAAGSGAGKPWVG